MDIKQTASGEYLFKLVFLQLIHAGTARHNHRLDIEVIQRIGDAMELYTVIGCNLAALVVITSRGLRVAAAQVTRWQNGNRTQ